MKYLMSSILLISSLTASASNLRDECENAYYADAGGVTQLHQYKASIEFGKLSDHLLVKIEDLIYGEGPLKAISEHDFITRDGRRLTLITLKEMTEHFDRVDYIQALAELAKFPGVTINCK